MTRRLSINLDHASDEERSLLPFLSAHTRQATMDGVTVELLPSNWQPLAQSHQRTSAAEKRTKLLSLLASLSQHPGDWVQLNEQIDYPLIDAVSPSELVFFIDHLFGLRTIESSRSDPSSLGSPLPKFRLTFKGWQEVESLNTRGAELSTGDRRPEQPGELTSPSTTAANMGTDQGITSQVFISYSWDSEEHKQWTLTLATRLRADGVDAIIDEAHLPLGARSPEFMERSVRRSVRVLVVCTPAYKRRFDNRQGGAGYEAQIITGEIITEVGSNKFIPILRSGEWKDSIPTALSGVRGVDLRKDSCGEYRRLVRHLYGVSDVPPVGPRPDWLDEAPESFQRAMATQPTAAPDLSRFVEQRKGLLETEVQKKIWSLRRWRVWIGPAKFRLARFQDLDQCRQFMLSSYVSIQGLPPFPRVSADLLEAGDEWIAGEIDTSDAGISRAERWVLFRSGQFGQNRTVDTIAQCGGGIHVLEILDTTTAVFEFAARMGQRGVLSPYAVITFELHGVDGSALSWPQDISRRSDAVGSGCWCQDEAIRVERQVAVDELEVRRRDLALEVALDIYSEFGWSDPPIARLIDQQARKFGAGRHRQ